MAEIILAQNSPSTAPFWDCVSILICLLLVVFQGWRLKYRYECLQEIEGLGFSFFVLGSTQGTFRERLGNTYVYCINLPLL